MSSGDQDAAVLAGRVGQEDALLLASGSAAIEVALEVLHVGPGDEVIVPDAGCHCVGAAAARTGATVVFTGVGEGLTLSPGDVQAALSDQTRAVIAVHQYGLPCDIHGIRQVLDPAAAVVEDFAQAWDLRMGEEVAGSLGDLSITSFGPRKPLSLGAGGAVFGRRELLGKGHGGRERDLPSPPTGARFPAPLLPLLPAAMATADDRVRTRRHCVARIMEFMAGQGAETVPVSPQCQPSWARLPLYFQAAPPEGGIIGPPGFVELTQPMHATPPSALPMFRNVPSRLVGGTPRSREPLLVKPASELSQA
jgi:hypothetical protein